METSIDRKVGRKVQSTRLGIGSWGFAALPDTCQEMSRIVSKVVEAYMLYHKPLLTTAETLLLIQNMRDKPQYGDKHLWKVRGVDNYVRKENCDYICQIPNANRLKVFMGEQGVT